MKDEQERGFQYKPREYADYLLLDVEPRSPLFYGIDSDVLDYVETFGDVDPPLLRRINGGRRGVYPEEGILSDMLLSRNSAQFAVTREIEDDHALFLESAKDFLNEVPQTRKYLPERTAIRGMIKTLKEIRQQKMASATSAEAFGALESRINDHLVETDMPYFLSLQSHPLTTPVAGQKNQSQGAGLHRYYAFNPIDHIAIERNGGVSFYVRTVDETIVRVNDEIRDKWGSIDVLFRAIEPQYTEELREIIERNRV